MYLIFPNQSCIIALKGAIMGLLNEQQRSLIMDWLRQGHNPYECVRLAEQAGFSITQQTIQGTYVPKIRAEREKALRNNEKTKTWFDKRFRAERAAEIAERLYADIMKGKMFAEEITEMETPAGIKRTHKPVYFAGMIKNWTDLNHMISAELGQNKQTVDINYNKNSNVNVSVLIDKIYEEDRNVQKQIEGAEIIDIPSDSDFGDDKAYLAIVNDQTSEEVRHLVENEDRYDDENDFLY